MAPTPEALTSPNSNPSQTNWLEKFKEILISNGITDPVSDVIVQEAGLKGENLTSQAHYVTVKFEEQVGRKPLNLFMKTTTSSPNHVEMVDDMRLFEKEKVFCMDYIPAARDFCKKLGKENLLDNYPKCYYADDRTIVFENLIEQGYVLLDKEKLQDFETAKIALTTLGKHHAISYAYVKEVGGPTNFFKMFPSLEFEAYGQKTSKAMLEPWIHQGISTSIAILEKSDNSVEGREETISELNSYFPKVLDLFYGNLEIEPADERLLLLNHGDYWNNNMLFRMDSSSGKLTGQIVVDFQMSRLATPSVDLGYYMYTSLKLDMRRERLPELLTIYLTALKETGRELGHAIDITYDNLFLDYRRKFHFGFWFGLAASNEVAYAVRKHMNLDDVPDISQFSAYMANLIRTWLEENPERCNKIGRNTVEIMKEYNELKIN